MLKWASKALLAKIEVTYGTDPTPTGAANAILATNVTLRPMEGEDIDRNLENAYFGGSPKIPVGLHAVLEFDVEVAPSGTAGTAPGWGPLLRMCSVAQTIVAATSVEYTPITDAPESGTIYMYIDTVLHKMIGTRGNGVASFSAQGIPVIRYTMTGLFVDPATVTKPTLTLSGFQAPQVATNANTPTFTIGGDAMVLRSFELNLGRQVERRLLIGKEEIVISDVAETVRATVESVALATYNPFTIAKNQTEQEIILVHGTGAGKITTITLPKCQQGRLTGYENQQGIVEWPLDFMPLPDAGDDQWSILLT